MFNRNNDHINARRQREALKLVHCKIEIEAWKWKSYKTHMKKKIEKEKELLSDMGGKICWKF